jgi:hypothetical protein
VRAGWWEGGKVGLCSINLWTGDARLQRRVGLGGWRMGRAYDRVVRGWRWFGICNGDCDDASDGAAWGFWVLGMAEMLWTSLVGF